MANIVAAGYSKRAEALGVSFFLLLYYRRH
jgi:hypothetical protein